MLVLEHLYSKQKHRWTFVYVVYSNPPGLCLFRGNCCTLQYFYLPCGKPAVESTRRKHTRGPSNLRYSTSACLWSKSRIFWLPSFLLRRFQCKIKLNTLRFLSNHFQPAAFHRTNLFPVSFVSLHLFHLSSTGKRDVLLTMSTQSR